MTQDRSWCFVSWLPVEEAGNPEWPASRGTPPLSPHHLALLFSRGVWRDLWVWAALPSVSLPRAVQRRPGPGRLTRVRSGRRAACCVLVGCLVTWDLRVCDGLQSALGGPCVESCNQPFLALECSTCVTVALASRCTVP